ncbi:MAG: hypothetical protein M3268_09575, partial [Acidobacteriota bacterium]|nr:hypothetical protein [Acidobacteriota bacterium]
MAVKEQKVVSLVRAGEVSPGGGALSRVVAGGGNSPNKNGRHQTALTLVKRPSATREVVGAGDGASASIPPDSQSPAGGVSVAGRPRMGWRGWLRALRIARVLGMLNLYLFLENYEAQAKFSARMSARRIEEARAEGGAKLRRARRLELIRRAVDRLIRAVRYLVFRGADESASKEARL